MSKKIIILYPTGCNPKFNVRDNIAQVTLEAPEGKLITVSDTYHTFEELYDHRIELFIVLCRKLKQLEALSSYAYDYYRVWRSLKNGDGSVWDGWFVMGLKKENGKQITYHLPISRWGDTDFAETLEQAPEFDGHTSQDVLERLKNL